MRVPSGKDVGSQPLYVAHASAVGAAPGYGRRIVPPPNPDPRPPTPAGMFEPEYVEVLGIPFSFLATTGKGGVRAKRTLDSYFRDDDGGERPWLFPQLRDIARRWIDECVTPYLGDGASTQLLMLAEWSHAAAERIYRAIAMGTEGERRLVPILRPYDPIGSTDDVCFDTTKTCFDTARSHINRVAQDSNWETELAAKLELMPEVASYAKNQGLNLKIPYTFEGRAANTSPTS
jgi:hypothetical protein